MIAITQSGIYMVQKIQSWPQKNLVLISQSSNLYMFLKGLVRSAGWNVLGTTPSVEEVARLISQKQASLIVIDDSPDEPAISIMRQLMEHMICFTTPIFSFILEDHKSDNQVLESIGQTEVVGKPLTPSRFLPAFTQLLRRWESKSYALLRMSSYRYHEEWDRRLFRDRLTKLMKFDELTHLAGITLARVFFEEEKITEAERVLLDIIKTDSGNLGSILALGDLYLKSALPALALRLFLSAYKTYGHSRSLLPDIIQAELMLCNVSGAMERLEEMRKHHYMSEQISPMLAKIYLSQGRLAEAEAALPDRKGLYQKMKDSWSQIC